MTSKQNLITCLPIPLQYKKQNKPLLRSVYNLMRNHFSYSHWMTSEYQCFAYTNHFMIWIFWVISCRISYRRCTFSRYFLCNLSYLSTIQKAYTICIIFSISLRLHNALFTFILKYSKRSILRLLSGRHTSNNRILFCP